MLSRTIFESTRDITSYETARAKVIAWGALMLAIYAIYVLVFPLTPTIHTADHILEIEQMLRQDRKWFAPLYVLGLGMLFYGFWRQLQIVHRLSNQDTRAANALRTWVLGIGILSGMLLLGLYPITALDVALYVVRARLWTFYGGSPMTAVPADFPQDPYIGLSGEYGNEVSPYGPVWELAAQVPIHLGLFDMASGILAMKVIALLAYIGMAVLVGWYARQDSPQSDVSGLTALTFFALNPLVLLQAIGNGHNDMLMLALITLGLVLWQREHWAWATFALTLAALVKITGLILLPLFAVVVLLAAPDWRTRILRGLVIAAIVVITSAIAYRLNGPFPEVFEGARHALLNRWGYTPAYALNVVAREIYPREGAIRATIGGWTRTLFALYFMYLLVSLARGKMNLIQAGFLAYFSQLLLGTTFRIWYPLWLIPFAALGLNSHTYWRTFLFGITAELSILVYLILWRWKLKEWEWGLHGPLQEYWKYWTITTLITVPWLFGIPVLGPLLLKWKDPQRFQNSLWI